ncbi:MAG: hypothetical protein ACI9QD_000962 [Thermoproteota archaeon]|jgi:hypothetical protein
MKNFQILKSLSNNESAFSLIEILISIVLLSLVMLSVISVTENSVTTKERVTSEDRESMQIETAMNKLQWDFNHIYSPLYFSIRYQFNEEEEELSQAVKSRYRESERYEEPDYNWRPIPLYVAENKSSFEFFTTSNRRKFEDQKESRFAWVKYTVEPSKTYDQKEDDYKDLPALVRYYSGANPYKNERLDTKNIKSQVLLERVEKIVFSYWDDKNKKFVDSLRYVENGKNLVRAIKIELIYKDSADILHNETRIFRTLFPSFKPEDLYKIIAEKTKANDEEKGEDE